MSYNATCHVYRILTIAMFEFSPNSAGVRPFRFIMPYVVNLGSPAFRRKLIDLIPNVALKRARDISDEIQRHARHIYETKKRALLEGDEAVVEQIGEGKDILSRLRTLASSVMKTRASISRPSIQCRQTWVRARRIN